MCAGDDEYAAGGADAFGAAAAEAISEGDSLDGGFLFDAGDGLLEGGTEFIGLVVKALFEGFDVDDMRHFAGEMSDFDIQDSAEDDGGPRFGHVGGGDGDVRVTRHEC